MVDAIKIDFTASPIVSAIVRVKSPMVKEKKVN